VNVAAVLSATLPKELVDALLAAHKEIETNYGLRKWKVSELDSGHFVEAARRILEYRLQSGVYTPIAKELSKFHDATLRQYEQATGDESHRILIPRVLRAIYGVRNKRGVGHLGPISPNEMDATLILYNVKWVLAEILRLESGLAPEVTQKAIDQIVERRVPLLWKDGDIVRVIDKTIKTREQVLLHLYDESPQPEAALREKCEYKNTTNFRKILTRLHADKRIFVRPDAVCLILPPGAAEAEKIGLNKSA
jgi:hypothetical protein